MISEKEIEAYLRKRIKNSDLKKDNNEMVVISISRLKNTIERMIKENESFLPETYRKKSRPLFIEELYQYLIELGFVQVIDDNNIVLYPVIGKLAGNYQEG